MSGSSSVLRVTQDYDTSKDYTVMDNEFWDGTDGAHPAWWRGYDKGAMDAYARIARNALRHAPDLFRKEKAQGPVLGLLAFIPRDANFFGDCDGVETRGRTDVRRSRCSSECTGGRCCDD